MFKFCKQWKNKLLKSPRHVQSWHCLVLLFGAVVSFRNDSIQTLTTSFILWICGLKFWCSVRNCFKGRSGEKSNIPRFNNPSTVLSAQGVIILVHSVNILPWFGLISKLGRPNRLYQDFDYMHRILRPLYRNQLKICDESHGSRCFIAIHCNFNTCSLNQSCSLEFTGAIDQICFHKHNSNGL